MRGGGGGGDAHHLFSTRRACLPRLASYYCVLLIPARPSPVTRQPLSCSTNNCGSPSAVGAFLPKQQWDLLQHLMNGGVWSPGTGDMGDVDLLLVGDYPRSSPNFVVITEYTSVVYSYATTLLRVPAVWFPWKNVYTNRRSKRSALEAEPHGTRAGVPGRAGRAVWLTYTAVFAPWPTQPSPPFGQPILGMRSFGLICGALCLGPAPFLPKIRAVMVIITLLLLLLLPSTTSSDVTLCSHVLLLQRGDLV